ncbi:MAG: hypothetical protein KKF58_05825 [Gammaproteobacteria bacterium]|nr:hypothetical protein [Gammaproteobacteria bacterium]MBU1447810.1 hypothetical protein [Gammaproteobacteria bacterium]
MATNINQLTPEKRAIVNQIIAIGKQLGASNDFIMAAVNIANAESAFRPIADNGISPSDFQCRTKGTGLSVQNQRYRSRFLSSELR